MAVRLLESLKESITLYSGLSPSSLFSVVALGLALYYTVPSLFETYQERPKDQPEEQVAQPLPPPFEVGEITDDELKTKPLLIAITLPPPFEVGEITDEELKQYDGTDKSKPLLMAIGGQIYDVSQSRMLYGPGGPYALYAGKDASRALAKMSFEEEDLNSDVTGLGAFELEALQAWEYNFMSKYVKVGTVKSSISRKSDYGQETISVDRLRCGCLH